MDFLGNQTGVAKKIKINTMIRLVPARIERKIGPFEGFSRLEGNFREGLLDASSEISGWPSLSSRFSQKKVNST